MFFRILPAPLFLIYKLWIGFVFWFTLLILYPAFYFLLKREKNYPRAFRLKRLWAKVLQVLLFCPVKRTYRAALPKGPYIVVSNHGSHLDTVFMYRVFTDYFLFIGKGELLRWPLFSLFFRTMDIPVDRENNKRAYASLQKAYDALERGECIAMYPEGTIPGSSPRMKAFKNGAFRMAIDKQVPIVPVTWQTNYKVLRDPEKIFSPSFPTVVRVVIHPPVYPPKHSDDRDLIALRNEVFRVIDSALPEKARKGDALPN
jgi:1-acyl-sn-glycerol-3-phosphate acyltransferase